MDESAEHGGPPEFQNVSPNHVLDSLRTLHREWALEQNLEASIHGRSFDDLSRTQQQQIIKHFIDLPIEVQGRVLEIARGNESMQNIENKKFCMFGLESCNKD
eukprot:m.343222 g.343222  ORF g.343222 m.343222 type:complete len:103 (-) comp22536_c0_seq1:356-664(-)